MKRRTKWYIGGCGLLLAGAAYGWKKGYYVCSECGYQFKPSFHEYFLAPHIFSKRNFYCPHCEKNQWFEKRNYDDINTSKCLY